MGRNFVVLPAGDDAVFLQLFQHRGKHGVGDAGNGFAQGAEAHGALAGELIYDGHPPLSAQDAEHVGQRTFRRLRRLRAVFPVGQRLQKIFIAHGQNYLPVIHGLSPCEAAVLPEQRSVLK